MRNLFLLIVSVVTLNAQANITLPKFVSDGMVLQRDAPINVWGWGNIGEKVTVVFNQKSQQTVTGKDGKWKLQLLPQKAGGPYRLSIKGKNEIVINDVLIGEVWVCSGQSNMEFQMWQVKDKYKEEIAASTNTFIRQFAVTKNISFTPIDTVLNESWKAANPINTLNFSAVAYFFAKELYAKYKVPIGLIYCNWGGTPAEAWTSIEGLKKFPNYLQRYDYISKPESIDKEKSRIATAKKNYQQKLDEFIKSDTTGLYYANGNYDASAWKKMRLPTLWENAGLPNFDGLVWFRKEIEIPAELAGKDAVIELSYIDDIDITYFNGQAIGSTTVHDVHRKYTIPGSLIKAGKNTIAIKVMDTGGGGGLYGDAALQLTIDGTVFSLKNEWSYQVENQKKLPAYPWSEATLFLHYEPTTMFNAMLNPIIPYTIKGVIWYQGEANVTRAKEYHTLFPNMIADWRKHWAIGDFPFLFVQLANFSDGTKNADWASLREVQTMTLSNTKNTGMAVTIDIGESYDIHPKNKKDVGTRLALAAENVAYHEKGIVSQGPTYQSYAIQGNKIIISFKNTGSGLLAKNGGLQQFLISGSDKKFVKANAVVEGNTVVVWSNEIQNPVAVRYAWNNNPEGCNLYNKEGLPAWTFRTDNW